MSKTENKDNIEISQDSDYLYFKVSKKNPLWEGTEIKINKAKEAYTTQIVAGLNTPQNQEQPNPVWIQDKTNEKISYGLVQFKIVGVIKQ